MKRTTGAASQAISQCRLCGHAVNGAHLSLGRLPVCNDFRKGEAGYRRASIEVLECETCELVQLRDALPVDALTPRLPWIRYREPEGHLDALVSELVALRPNTKSALGTGPFEQPLLSRLAARGVATSSLAIDVAPAAGRYPYLETWQAGLNAQRLAEKAAQLGTFDLVSCRYIVEHAPQPVSALVALKSLVAADGLLVIEVPDSSKFLAACDYCFLWEEHSCYFVEETLRRLAEAAGFRVLGLLRYPGALEDALVAVLQVTYTPTMQLSRPGPSLAFAAYRDHFGATRERLRARLVRAAGPARDRLALFGIGHHAIMFANAFGVADLIALVVDDDPDKAGFFPPGFRVPVVSSQALLENARIATCLFAVASPVRARVEAKLMPLAERGVEFRSIYAALEDSIMKDLA